MLGENHIRHKCIILKDNTDSICRGTAQSANYAASQWRRFEKVWGWLDGELSDGRTWLVEDRFSIADITGMAALFICDIAEKTTPRDARHARRWEDALRARPSFAERLPKAA